jgi:hypothetical protein
LKEFERDFQKSNPKYKLAKPEDTLKNGRKHPPSSSKPSNFELQPDVVMTQWPNPHTHLEKIKNTMVLAQTALSVPPPLNPNST